MNQILTELGLTPEQAGIYDSLLENGSQTAVSLAKTSQVLRTHVYNVCRQLASLGLVREDKKGNTTIFVALSPDKLLDIAANKREQYKRVEQTLDEVLPGLKSLFQKQEVKPTVIYYEGFEGIKKTYNDTLRTGLPILALIETTKVSPEVYEWVTREYATKRVKAGISVRSIAASGDKTTEYTSKDEAELRETKVINSSKFPFEHEINIYGTKVAIINHKAGDKQIGIIIDNETIASTFRSWFELTWSLLA